MYYNPCTMTCFIVIFVLILRLPRLMIYLYYYYYYVLSSISLLVKCSALYFEIILIFAISNSVAFLNEILIILCKRLIEMLCKILFVRNIWNILYFLIFLLSKNFQGFGFLSLTLCIILFQVAHSGNIMSSGFLKIFRKYSDTKLEF